MALQHGFEYYETESRAEAIAGILKPVSTVILPNPVIRTFNNAIKTTKGISNLSIRKDIVLNGGRSGQLVKTLTGPANSVVKGGQGRIFITNSEGKVILDITKDRVKSVIPGRGFGPKVTPTQEQLNLLKQVWGN